MSTSPELTKGQPPVGIILQAGLIAGTLDILAAFTNAYLSSGVSPLAVLRYVASGVFGNTAFSGGMPMAAAGLLIHFLIATAWAALFYLLYPIIRKISTNWIINGLVYGIVVWLIMNLVMLPLSNTPVGPVKFSPQAFIGMGILMLCIGLPISWIVQRSYNGTKQNTRFSGGIC